MRVMFVYAGFENLGIEYLSAVLKQKGHETRLAFDPRLFNDQFLSVKFLAKLFDYESILLEEIKRYNPRLLLFSVVSSDYQWALKIAKKIKEMMDVPIAFGGIHPTSAPETVLKNDCVDYIIIGEGEYPLLELVERLEGGESTERIRNVWCKRNGRIIRNPLRPLIKDLDSLPFPDKDLYYDLMPSYKKGYKIITRRGCPNKCSYCHNSVWKRLYPKEKSVRFRSVWNVMAELKNAKMKYGIKRVRINDDLFSLNGDWLKEFSKAYKAEIALPLYCFVSPETTNENVVRSLKEMGCYQVCMGVQSLNEKTREKILNRKGTNKDIINAIRLYKKYRIRCVVDNILGLPGETEQDIIEMARFYNENRIYGRIAIFWLVYFPNTDIIDIAKNKKILTDETIECLKEKPDFAANTLQGPIHKKDRIKYHWLILLIHFMPKIFIRFIIKRRLYKYLPAISPSILEIPFTIFSKDRLDIVRIRYYLRYLHYMPKIIKYKI